MKRILIGAAALMAASAGFATHFTSEEKRADAQQQYTVKVVVDGTFNENQAPKLAIATKKLGARKHQLHMATPITSNVDALSYADARTSKPYTQLTYTTTFMATAPKKLFLVSKAGTALCELRNPIVNGQQLTFTIANGVNARCFALQDGTGRVYVPKAS